MSGIGYTFKDGDWTRLRQIMQKIASVQFGYESSPTFSGLELTGDLTVGGSLTLTGLTASRLVSTNASKSLESSDTSDWIAGTANQITITDDGDGTATVSIPDTLVVTTSGQFGTLLCAGGSITDSSGEISFGNEDLITTGTLEVGGLVDLSVTPFNGVRAIVGFTKDANGVTGVLISNTNTGNLADQRIVVRDTTGHYFAFSLPSTGNLSGNLFGLPRSSTAFLFNYGGTSRGIAIGTLASENLTLGTANAARVTITSAGLVGINDTTPSYRLDVDGVIRATSVVYADTGVVVRSNNDGLNLGEDLEVAFYYNGSNAVIAVTVGDLLIETDVKLTGDNDHLYIGAGNDLDLYHDGTDSFIVTDATQATDLIIDCGTDKTIELAETVWDDLPPTPIIISKLGATAPTLTNFTSANIQQYTFGVGDLVYGSTELTHKWKEGTTILPHIHYATQSNDGTDRGCQWELIYSIGDGNEAFSSEFTTVVDDTIPSGTAVRTHLIPGFDTSVTATTYKIGAYILWRLKRIATAHANGEPSSDPYGIAVGFHAEQDTIGSRQVFIK